MLDKGKYYCQIWITNQEARFIAYTVCCYVVIWLIANLFGSMQLWSRILKE